MPRVPLSLLTAVVLTASACGAEAVPPEGVAAATEATGSARIESVTRIESAGRTHEHRTSTVVDYVNDRREFIVEPGGCRTILIGATTYFEVPPHPGLPAGKRWVRHSDGGRSSEEIFEESVREQESGWTGYAEIHLFTSSAPAPDDYLDYLRELSADLEAVGEEDVRGAATTRYRTTVDTERRIRHDLEADGWKAANIDRYLESVVSTTEEVDVWVDEEGRVRRIVTSYTPSTTFPTRSTTTTDYFDFGLDAQIEPPPAEAVLGQGEWQRVTDALTASSESVSPPSCLH